MNNYIFFIPARTGSKGVIGKNFKIIGDQPLINHTLELVNRISLPYKKVIVSTDNVNYKHLVESCGFLFDQRPMMLSGDDSLIHDVILDSIKRLNCKVLSTERENWLILLEPTTPLRTFKTLDNLIRRIESSKKNAFVSVIDSHSVFWKFNTATQSYLRESVKSSLRQERSNVLQEVGVFYASEWKHYCKFGFFSDDTQFVHVPKCESFDINDNEDWIIVDRLISNK